MRMTLRSRGAFANDWRDPALSTPENPRIESIVYMAEILLILWHSPKPFLAGELFDPVQGPYGNNPTTVLIEVLKLTFPHIQFRTQALLSSFSTLISTKRSSSLSEGISTKPFGARRTR